MGTVWNQILASIMANALYVMRNNPLVMLRSVLAPVSFLLLIFFVSRGELLDIAILGGFISTMFSCGATLQHHMDHMKSDFKTQEMIVSSPTRSIVYIVGMGLSELIYILPTIAIFAILFYFNIQVSFLELLVIILILFLVFIISVTFHFTLETFSSDANQSFTSNQLVAIFFSTLAPVSYPITMIPEPFRYFAYLSPTTYAAQFLQGITDLQDVSNEMLMIDLGVLIAISIVMMRISIRNARWRER